jgi:hypothetical protein
VRWCGVVFLEKLTSLGRTLKLKKSSVDGGLGCILFVTFLHLLLAYDWLLVFVSSESLMLSAAGRVIALDAKLPSPLPSLVWLDKP